MDDVQVHTRSKGWESDYLKVELYRPSKKYTSISANYTRHGELGRSRG